MKQREIMSAIVLFCILAFVGCATAPHPEEGGTMDSSAGTVEQSVLTGIWQGVLKAGGQEIRLVFHFAFDDGAWTATVDSPDQGATGIPVAEVRVDGLDLHLDIPAVAGTYDGTIDPSVPKVIGKWNQGGGSFAVDLTKIEKVEKVTRPQDPVPPFPYDVREVTFVNEEEGITLAGTLTMPAGSGPHPGVVLVSGSGPQNRDEEIMNHRPFLVLADHLTREGIAVLRYDDRGVGRSGGDFTTATSKNFARDAYAALSFLESQPDVDTGKTGIIGHSEGGIIAPMIAAEHPEVDFIVLLAGPGIIGKELLLQQSAAILNAAGATQDQIDQAREINRTIYEIVTTEPDDEKARKELESIYGSLGVPEDRAQLEIDQILNPWFRFFLSHDPAEDLKNTACPVLALNGTLDLQVPADENLAAIEKALAEGGNSRVTIQKLNGLNHLFQHAQTGLVEEYTKIEETFAPEALQHISEWILNTAGRRLSSL